MDRLPVVEYFESTATLATLPSECYLLLLSTMNNEQLEAFMRTSKKLRAVFRFCEKLVRNMNSTHMSNLQEPPASPLPLRSWSFLAHEGDELE